MIVAGIPAFNEEKTIARIILEAQRYVDMVLVCDDGSRDLTATIARKMGAVVITHDKNMGYGLALQSLFKKASDLNADVLLTLDADGQHNAKDISKLVQPIVDSKADIVIGSRFLEGAKGIPTYRRFGIKLLTRFANRGDKNRTSDAQSGFRAYNRRALESITLHEKGMGVSAEILMKAADQRLRIAEVPVQVRYKDLDTSTHNPLGHGLSVLVTIIRLIVEERPLTYLGIPGLLLLGIGASLGIWALYIFATQGVVTIIALISFAFTLYGMFTLFTAVTLYAIVRIAYLVSKRVGVLKDVEN